MMAMSRVIMSKPLLCSLVADEYIFYYRTDFFVGAAHNVKSESSFVLNMTKIGVNQVCESPFKVFPAF